MLQEIKITLNIKIPKFRLFHTSLDFLRTEIWLKRQIFGVDHPGRCAYKIMREKGGEEEVKKLEERLV